jgi:hypothetical protein
MPIHQKIYDIYLKATYYVYSTVLLFGLFYCIYSRSFADILKYTGQLFIFFLLFIRIITKNAIADEHMKWPKSFIDNKFKRILFGVFITMIIAYMFYAIGVTITDLSKLISNWQPNIFKVLGVLMLAVSGSYAAYELRLKHRTKFGVFEVLTGFSILFYKMMYTPEKTTELFFTIITAGILLMVKGYDDIDQGKIEKEQLTNNSIINLKR